MSAVYKCSRRREIYLAFYLMCFTTQNLLVTRTLVLFILPLGVLLPFLLESMPYSAEDLGVLQASLVSMHCGTSHPWSMFWLHFSVDMFTLNLNRRNIQANQPWTINMDESGWWIFPAGLVACKFLQSRLINWHVANLEIQDRSLSSNEFDMFWQS
ncbi:uncharacterized protein LOC120074977 [Benincasa hispida]|uniref:uncharacterized protein LOC120074977 n=1 Tax=Benincasa hispida TaxID=102211 RepID=UPI00190063EA|nr:uncharacterized protein LOC120074977 [Benincasa hispida]XP_038884028.1 uncharacterized protein LOC120074977 [Benincasa hispida]XP_038884030.1 uncharacterized protein LOC120074977 [Benincasa hispida]